MSISEKLFGELKTKSKRNRRKERFYSVVVTIVSLPLIPFFVIGQFAGIRLATMAAWERKKTEEMIKQESKK